MSRKDCEILKYLAGRAWIAALAIAACPGIAALAGQDGRVGASSIRLWPTAVVTGRQVTLADVCDFSGLDGAARAKLSAAIVTPSPMPGESKRIRLKDVRATLRRAGANPAAILLIGSTACTISHPADAPANPTLPGRRPRQVDRQSMPGPTLADAVGKAFRENTQRLGGKVDVQIGRTSEDILSLAEPEYTFVVRNKKNRWIGKLLALEVDVLRGGRLVRSVPLVASATITRQVVVARRAINQKATVRHDDVFLADRVYDNTNGSHATSIEQVVGRRAKRFVPAGQAIPAAELEEIPLVLRGQVVEVVSTAGNVEILTAAKALSNGGIGDVIELRAGGRRSESMSGIVVGVGRVRIGRARPQQSAAGRRLAVGVK
jgi:flagella basal body P-ring formation protein FlgA